MIDRLLAPTWDPLTSLAAAAAVTERITLLTSVLLAPLRPARLLAAQAATVDRLSEGRLMLGLGVGSRAEDYDAAGADYGQRGRILDEQLGVLRHGWTEPHGVGPTPIRPGGPPLLFGGYAAAGRRRAAEAGVGWISARGGAPAYRPGAQQVRDRWTAAGRAGTPLLLSSVHFSLGPGAREARDRFMYSYYGTKSFAHEMVDETPTSIAQLAEIIEKHGEAGCDAIVLLPCSADLDQVAALASLSAGHATPIHELCDFP